MRKDTAPGRLAGKQASRVPERDRPMCTLPEIEQKIALARAAKQAFRLWIRLIFGSRTAFHCRRKGEK